MLRERAASVIVKAATHPACSGCEKPQVYKDKGKPNLFPLLPSGLYIPVGMGKVGYHHFHRSDKSRNPHRDLQSKGPTTPSWEPYLEAQFTNPPILRSLDPMDLAYADIIVSIDQILKLLALTGIFRVKARQRRAGSPTLKVSDDKVALTKLPN